MWYLNKLTEPKQEILVLWSVFSSSLMGKRSKGELDIELNKLGSISVFASPGSYSSLHHRRSEHCSAKGINTPRSPLQYWIVERMQREVLEHSGLSV